MEPIINPMLIYLVSLCSTIKAASVFLCASTIVVALFIFLFGFILDEIDKDKDWCISIIKYCVVVFFISLFFAIIVPGRETALAMLATYYVTPDNIQAVQGNIIEFIKQLVSAVKEVQ